MTAGGVDQRAEVRRAVARRGTPSRSRPPSRRTPGSSAARSSTLDLVLEALAVDRLPPTAASKRDPAQPGLGVQPILRPVERRNARRVRVFPNLLLNGTSPVRPRAPSTIVSSPTVEAGRRPRGRCGPGAVLPVGVGADDVKPRGDRSAMWAKLKSSTPGPCRGCRGCSTTVPPLDRRRWPGTPRSYAAELPSFTTTIVEVTGGREQRRATATPGARRARTTGSAGSWPRYLRPEPMWQEDVGRAPFVALAERVVHHRAVDVHGGRAAAVEVVGHGGAQAP